MQNQINTSQITQFSQQLKAAELGQHKELRISIQNARLLNIALVELLDKVNRDYESLLNDLKNSNNKEEISVMLDGGSFESE